MSPTQNYVLASAALAALGTAITEPANLRVRAANEFNSSVYRDLAMGVGVAIAVSAVRGFLRKTMITN